MDFYEVKTKRLRSNNREADFIIYPDFLYTDSQDLVCKGGDMYAFWDGEKWDTNLMHLINHIDKDLYSVRNDMKAKDPDYQYAVKSMRSNSSKIRSDFKNYTNLMPQSDISFNTKIIFSNTTPKREDYTTNILPYTPAKGSTENFDTLIDRLYAPEEKLKIMWFMGALLTNSMGDIQKFMFLYGGKGTGKGTVLKIFKKVFQGYHKPISLKVLSGTSAFATAQVQEVPLLIDEDCNLSQIQDDTPLLKLTAHEPINVNRKYQTPYDVIFPGLLITASNQRYKVRNVDSGITRRAVVVEPTSFTFDGETYFDLMHKIDYEIPAIAKNAIDIFKKLGSHYYDDHVDRDMIEASDYIFEFVSLYWEQLGDEVSLTRAAELYKEYLDDLGFDTKGYKRKIKTELQRYYREFIHQKKVNGVNIKNVFVGLKKELFLDVKKEEKHLDTNWLELDAVGDEPFIDPSIFGRKYFNQPAQYANEEGNPKYTWDKCRTKLKSIDERELHFVRVPENHIVIDFDLKDKDGNKSLELNLEAANKFPSTYAEVSKSGGGLHLHYIYDGNVDDLSRIYEPNVEIKVFKGKASLRRKLTRCNHEEIRHISTGLPLKETNRKMYDQAKDIIWNEKGMRTAIERNLAKEYHANTTPSMHFIKKIFEDAEAQGLKYDLRDMESDIMIFASLSSHQAKECTKIAREINYCTIEEPDIEKFQSNSSKIYPIDELHSFDLEVFPNLLLVCYRSFKDGSERHKLFNPSPQEIEQLLQLPLVGFNNRNYDNHILYARLLGKSNAEIFEISQTIVEKSKKESADLRYGGKFSNAYELSYTDIYDFSATKQSLKKWEIELGIIHDELGFDFNKPLPKEYWERAAEYCFHDVDANIAVFNHLLPDYEARLMLCELSGLSPNATNNQHTARILFGDDPRPQDKFNYTDLSTIFPGYEYNRYGIDKERYVEPPVAGKSIYMGIDPSEGGYVYSNPGIYTNCKVFDVASMHPTSLEELNYFGPYQQNYSDLKKARIFIKHKDFDSAGKLFGGKLKPYLKDPATAKQLAYALKIILNTVYGMTSASFDNKFKHPKNVDNIVAKRGALFMITLRKECEDRGMKVVHIKTDSIKIANPTKEDEEFIIEFGKKYGYVFEIEDIFKRVALINRAVLIGEKEDGEWEAVGAQFAEPYVMKSLFTGDPIVKEDFFVIKEVRGQIFIGDEFIGRICRVYASKTGQDLWRVSGDKKAAVADTKGYKWKLDSEFTDITDVDMSYYHEKVKKAIEAINKVGPSGNIITQTGWFDDLVTYY